MKESKLLCLEGISSKTIVLTELIDAIISEYYFNINKIKVKDIIVKRFGLMGNNQYSLEQIGSYFDITRQRIEQIEKNELKTFKKLLNGELIKRNGIKYDIILNDEVVGIFNQINDEISTNRLISQREFYNEIKNNFKVNFENDTKYIDFLMYVLFAESKKIKYVDFKENKIFILDNSLNTSSIQLMCKKMYTKISNSIASIDEFELFTYVKGRKSKIDNKDLNRISDLIYEIEKVDIDGKIKCRLKFEYLTSLKDAAYRILSEEKRFMHYQEINSFINKKFIELGKKPISDDRNLRNQMNKELFISDGKSGNWGLKEWNKKTGLIIDDVVEILQKNFKPLDRNEIIQGIKINRPEVKKASINTYLDSRKDVFLKLDDGRFILKNWESMYRDRIKKEKEVRYSNDKFISDLVKLFENNDNQELSLNEMWCEFTEKYTIKKSSFEIKVRNMKILTRRKVGKMHNYKLNYNYKEYLDNELNKLKSIEIKTKELLYLNNNSMYLSSIIKELTKEYGYSKSSIYRAIDESKIFEKHGANKKIEIKLKKSIYNKSGTNNITYNIYKDSYVNQGNVGAMGENAESNYNDIK